MADVMQPALVSLQPSIPDIMASFGWCFLIIIYLSFTL